MEKERKRPERFVFMRDDTLSRTGFADFAAAKEAEAELRRRHPNEETHRIRTRLRNRTGRWDVVVKVRTPVREPTPAPSGAGTAIAQHALTGE